MMRKNPDRLIEIDISSLSHFGWMTNGAASKTRELILTNAISYYANRSIRVGMESVGVFPKSVRMCVPDLFSLFFFFFFFARSPGSVVQCCRQGPRKHKQVLGGGADVPGIAGPAAIGAWSLVAFWSQAAGDRPLTTKRAPQIASPPLFGDKPKS